jgi:glycerophosphoryl diester phosphodiesterase
MQSKYFFTEFRLVTAMCVVVAAFSFSARAQLKNDITSLRREKTAVNVLVACHRGGLWQKFPENSLEAIQAAIDLGADFIEIDVRKTKDGQLVLMHDRTLKRTTDGDGQVKDKTLAEIKAFFLKDKTGKVTSYKVPALKEALLLMKGKVFIKMDKYNEESIKDEIMAVLNETGTTRQASFRVGLQYSKLKKNYGDAMKTLHLFPAVEDDDSAVQHLRPAIQKFKEKINPVVFQAKFKNDTSIVVTYIGELNKAGYHVWVMSSRPYFCGGWDDKLSLKDPSKGWGRLIGAGVTVLETDYPEELIAYLRTRKLHQ